MRLTTRNDMPSFDKQFSIILVTVEVTGECYWWRWEFLRSNHNIHLLQSRDLDVSQGRVLMIQIDVINLLSLLSPLLQWQRNDFDVWGNVFMVEEFNKFVVNCVHGYRPQPFYGLWFRLLCHYNYGCFARCRYPDILDSLLGRYKI